MHQYGVQDVERLLCLPRSTIHSLVKAGFVTPARGPRRSYLFSFQDLIVLRTAQALAAAKVPPKRIARSLKELRRQLPGTMPLSGLAISAEGDRVVVKEGASRWQADSGQYLLAFGGDPDEGDRVVVKEGASRWQPAKHIGTRSRRIRRTWTRPSIWAVCCTKAGVSRKPKGSTARRSRRAAASRCCYSTWACYSRISVGRTRRWRRTSGPCTVIRCSRTATTTSRFSASDSTGRARPFDTWRSTGGWFGSDRTDRSHASPYPGALGRGKCAGALLTLRAA